MQPAARPLRTPPFLVATALALLAAGCIGTPAPDATVAPAGADTLTAPVEPSPGGNESAADPDERAPRVVVVASNGTITQVAASAAFDGANLILGGPVVAGENVEGEFTPGVNATAIVVELVWADATWDLDVYVRAPDAEEVLVPEQGAGGFTTTRGHAWADADGNTGSPDGHAFVVAADPEVLALPGAWSWYVDSKTAREVAFTLYVSVFYGGLPDGAYTAVAV